MIINYAADVFGQIFVNIPIGIVGDAVVSSSKQAIEAARFGVASGAGGIKNFVNLVGGGAAGFEPKILTRSSDIL